MECSHLRRITLRTLGIVGADMLSQGVRIAVMGGPFGWADGARLVAEVGRHSLLLGAGLALALELGEAPWWRDDPVRRWAAVAAAVPLAVAASALLIATDIGGVLGLTASDDALRLHALWNNSIVAIVAVAYLTRRRESLEVEQRRLALALRLAHARARLDAIGTRTGQSRLQPEMVLDCLVRARDVYPIDPHRGDTLLERLTRYLRLTLGIAGEADATLACEAELAAARINVERGDADPPMDLRVAPSAARARFPPDLLGPLAHDWLRQPGAGPWRMLRLQAEHDARALHVWLDGPCPVPDGALRRVADRLDAFGGARGSVTAQAHSLHLEISHG